jgi:homogentisate 1,2-dioxygenase
MKIPYVRGRVALQAHVGLPEGTVEEEFARDGFSGRYAHLYRRQPPVNWTRIEGPLRPRAYQASQAASPPEAAGGDLLGQRRPLLWNEDVTVGMASLDAPMPYALRDADADEVLFIHEGAGRLESDFGPLAYEPGDYLLIPRGTAFRLVPTSATRLLTLEVRSEVGFPDRGMLGQHALFDPAVVRVPSPDETASMEPDERGEYELRILRLGEVTRVHYPFCPLNTVGWKGTLAVMQLNVRDIRPVLSDRYHLPPSAHTTLLGRGVVVCTFLPRPLENGDPTALKVPFYHSNIDYDEVIFYHRGQFFSRQGVGPGMMTLHPQGIHHGPQPGAADRAAGAQRTDEVAVMIDTRRPLEPTDAARGVEVHDYWRSWNDGSR